MRGAAVFVLSSFLAVSCGPLPDDGGEPSAETPPVTDGEPKTTGLTELFNGGEHRWNDDLKLDITYCVDAGFGADRNQVISKLAEATADWSYDVQVAFRFISSITSNCFGSSARLRVIPGLSYGCPTADGGTSYTYAPRTCPDGSPPQMLPNSANLDPATQKAAIALVFASVTDPNDLLHVVKHELGHALGFDHEDGTLGCSSNHNVGSQPLTAPDPSSIMLTSSCGVPPPQTLSALDRQGAGLLYGHVVDSTTEFPSQTMAKGRWFSTGAPIALGANRTFSAMIAGTGNLDLYLGVGFTPTLTRFTMASRGSTASETLSVQLPPVFPFGQDIYVSVYAASAGTLQTFRVSSGRLDNPMDLVSRIGAEAASYDATLTYPACARASRSCDSGTNLKGRGRLSGGVEAHASNHAGAGCPDGSSGIYGFDESIEAIRIVSADSGPLRPSGSANVFVDVVSWSTTADRLELFYQAESGGPWFKMGTQNPATTGRTRMVFPVVLKGGGSVQAMRAVFRYSAASSSACPTDLTTFDDVDDLSFTVASVYEGYRFN